jgi:predicted nucleic acid-binding protein
MAGGLAYLDTSALVKLVLPEAESDPLAEALASWPQRASSCLAEVELVRAIRRATGEERALARAEEVLAGLYLLAVDAEVLRLAALLEPLELRSLDALHLASALAVEEDLGAFIAYDHRLVEAARALRLPLVRPGAR